ncbi:hypothetical protein AAFP35_21360 [Gordonia sp. CPCC 206044]|uniref:hypothetical protein n=1 Tax=Gordonia sp. CPCC 206044 TaxID=3140793 RepID=UPI003AF3E1AC
MAKGVLLVESRPSSPERAEEFDTWYETVHIPEVLALDGFVAARRYRPVKEDEPHVSIYDIEADDVVLAVKGLSAAAARGEFQMSDAMQMDPPPSMRILELTTEQP